MRKSFFRKGLLPIDRALMRAPDRYSLQPPETAPAGMATARKADLRMDLSALGGPVRIEPTRHMSGWQTHAIHGASTNTRSDSAAGVKPADAQRPGPRPATCSHGAPGDDRPHSVIPMLEAFCPAVR